MRSYIAQLQKAGDDISVEKRSEQKKAENSNGIVDHADRSLLRPSSINFAAPPTRCRYPIIEIAPRRKVVWVWICCVCGYGGMKVSVDPCPNCCNPRCPNCDTRRINTRSHKHFNYQRGSWSSDNIEVETGPAPGLDLILPVGKLLAGVVTEEEGEEEGEPG